MYSEMLASQWGHTSFNLPLYNVKVVGDKLTWTLSVLKEPYPWNTLVGSPCHFSLFSVLSASFQLGLTHSVSKLGLQHTFYSIIV